MNKCTFILALLLALARPCFSQNAFYDAKKIIRLQNELSAGTNQTATVDNILAILLKYKDSSGVAVARQVKPLSIDEIWGAYNKQVKDKSIDNLFNTVVSNRIIDTKLIPELIDKIQDKKTDGISEIRDSLGKKVLYEKALAVMSQMNTDTNLVVVAGDEIKNLPLFNKLNCKPDSFYRCALKTIGIESLKLRLVDLDKNIKNIFDAKKLINKIPNAIIAASYESRSAYLISSGIEKAENTQKIVIEQVIAARSGIPSQSDVIDAMAIYLANRVKLETTLTFFELMKSRMKEEALLLALFPKTQAVLTSYASYQLPNFGSEWRQAFSADFVGIPEKLAGDTSGYFAKRFGKNANVYFSFLQQATEFAGAYRQNPNIIDVVEYLRLRNAGKNSVLTDYINLLALINDELYSTGGKDYWISYTEFLRMNDVEFEMMLSLLKNRYPSVMRKFNIDLFEDNGLTAKEFKLWLSDIIYLVNQFQQVQNSTFISSGGTKAGNYWVFASDMFDKMLAKSGNKSVLQLRIPAGQENYIARVSDLFHSLSKLYSAIEEKNYMLAVNHTVSLIKSFEDQNIINLKRFNALFYNGAGQLPVGPSFASFQAKALVGIDLMDRYVAASQDKKDEIKRQIADVQIELKNMLADAELKSKLAKYYRDHAGNFLTGMLDRYQQFDERLKNNEYGRFTSALTFVVDVARAESSEDLSRVISSRAAPPGSYRIKRNTFRSWDVNAYVGMIAGLESQSIGLGSSKFVYGLTAPIGISYSWGTKGNKGTYYLRKNGKSGFLTGNAWSVSLTLIDIGAVVKYRLDDKGPETAKGLPYKVSFSQFISPALHVHRGIKGTPFTGFLGLQYLPQLRNLSADADLPVRKFEGVAQLNAGITFDLPLFHFANNRVEY